MPDLIRNPVLSWIPASAGGMAFSENINILAGRKIGENELPRSN
jgi:hypothetical protein